MLNNYVCSVFTKDGEHNVTLEPNSTIEDILITEDMEKNKSENLNHTVLKVQKT